MMSCVQFCAVVEFWLTLTRDCVSRWVQLSRCCSKMCCLFYCKAALELAGCSSTCSFVAGVSCGLTSFEGFH